MTKQITLPEFCHFGHLIDILYTNNIYDVNEKEFLFNLSEDCYFTPESLAFFCAWAIDGKQRGNTFIFQGSDDILNYLSRMDLFKHLGFPFDEDFNRRQEIGRFIPIQLIHSYEDVNPITDAICELVLHQFEDARVFLPAMEWSVNEIIDNVFNHACINSPAAVYGQYYPGKRRLEVAIVDTGQGIKASLEESFELEDDGAALLKAIQRGVTRNKDAGQGNGLAGTREIVLKNGGSFRLWSGSSQYHISKGTEVGCEDIPYTRGTGVLIKLFTDNPVDLGDIFISQPDWSYIDVLCEEIAEAGSLKVKDEVVNTVTRQAARPLRLKIEALLPDMDVPLVLDFSGVEKATNSFMDELLGMLYYQYHEEFSARIQLMHCTDIIQALANSVIGQRIS